MSNEKDAVYTAYGKNKYQLSMQDYGDMCTLMATASLDSRVLHAKIEKDGGRSEWQVVPGTFKEAVFKQAGLTIEDDGFVTTAAHQIEMEKTASHISAVVGGTDIYETVLNKDQQLLAQASAQITKEAAPSRVTFRPSAVRYELAKEDVDKLGSTLSGMYDPHAVYRVVSTSDSSEKLGTLNNDSLFDMIGCKRLASGNAAMRDKAISLFQLENGFTIKIGSAYLLVATTAQPRFKEKEPVMVVVMNPDGNGHCYKSTVTKSHGYDANAGDFMYEVAYEDGQTNTVGEKVLQPVPETPSENQQSVSLNHF